MTERDKWLMQAVRDLETARNSLNSGDYYASAFWAQQAVEKALKALLLSWGKSYRGHDLVEMGYLVRDELGLDVSPIIDDLRALTAHYTTSRYPDAANAVPYEIYTRADAEEALERASRVIEWVRRNLR
jgi:HEPN domain-containing protein